MESIESTFAGLKKRFVIKAITRNVFRGILTHYYEKLFNAYSDISELRTFFEESIKTSHLEKLDKAMGQGMGVLFVTGHYGGIEYIPIFLALKGYPMSVIAKFSTKQLKEVTYLQTKDLGLQLIDTERESNVWGSVIRALRKNRIVFIQCDEIEKWKQSQNENMLFLGKTIGVDKTINLIQKRTGAEVIFGLLHRFNSRKYRLIIESCEDMLSKLGKRHSSVGKLVLKTFEQYVYAHPEQWYLWEDYAEIRTLRNP